MAQNIGPLQGAYFSAVPAVDLPKQGGGTARFTDVTDTTATAADVAAGKYFFDAAGNYTEGTSTGGGGFIDVIETLPGGGDHHIITSTGVEMEGGTFTPVSNSYIDTRINFGNIHNSAPSIITIVDTTGNYASTSKSLFYCSIVNFYALLGHEIQAPGSNATGLEVSYRLTRNNTTWIDYSYADQTINASMYLDSSGFCIDPWGDEAVYYRAGNPYQWVAIWK